MSAYAVRHVVPLASELPWTRYQVLVAMAMAADERGTVAMGIDRICEQTKFSRRTVQRSLADLCRRGLLCQINNPTRGGRGKKGCYRIVGNVPRRTVSAP